MRIARSPLPILVAALALALAGCGPAVERPPLLVDGAGAWRRRRSRS
jgi:hypothetical protein